MMQHKMTAIITGVPACFVISNAIIHNTAAASRILTSIPHVKASEIADDHKIKVVFFKEALLLLCSELSEVIQPGRQHSLF